MRALAVIVFIVLMVVVWSAVCYLKYRMDYTPDNKILEDKFFFRFRGDNVRGEFIDSYPGGRSVWLTKEEIQKLPDLFPDVLEGMESMEREGIAYEENKYTAEGY